MGSQLTFVKFKQLLLENFGSCVDLVGYMVYYNIMLLLYYCYCNKTFNLLGSQGNVLSSCHPSHQSNTFFCYLGWQLGFNSYLTRQNPHQLVRIWTAKSFKLVNQFQVIDVIRPMALKWMNFCCIFMHSNSPKLLYIIHLSIYHNPKTAIFVVIL